MENNIIDYNKIVSLAKVSFNVGNLIILMSYTLNKLGLTHDNSILNNWFLSLNRNNILFQEGRIRCLELRNKQSRRSGLPTIVAAYLQTLCV